MHRFTGAMHSYATPFVGRLFRVRPKITIFGKWYTCTFPVLLFHEFSERMGGTNEDWKSLE